MRHLLTMTSGLHWNGLRDYNVFTGFDRVHDALTLGIDHRPGTYFEYAQSPVSLLAEAIGRSAGTDAGAFAQKELFTPLGIEPGSWGWTRDKSGHIGGFYGVQMRTEDYARMGELMRRGGVWRGKRLLSKTYMRDSITPTRTNGCYGYLIWLNRDAPCVGPTITERPVDTGARVPRPAGGHVPLLRAVRPAGHGVPVAGHRGGPQRSGPRAAACPPAAAPGSTRSTARCWPR